MRQHIVVIGGGAIGIISAIELLRAGHRVTIVEPGAPGGEQASSYGNAGWLSSHSVIPPSEPGLWKQIPKLLRDPLGPLAIRWRYLPRAAPWLIRYLLSGATASRVEKAARALRPLLAGAPALHKQLAAEAGVSHLIEQAGLMHVFLSRADFEKGRLGWDIRRKLGIQWIELPEDELRQREPLLHRRYTFALLVEEAGRCRDPGAYIAALAGLAQERGAILIKDKATGLRLDRGRLSAVETATTGAIACDKAVIAAGARSKALAAAAGSHIPLETERGYHAMLTGAPETLRTSIMASDLKLVVNPMAGGLRAAGQVEIAGLEAAPNWKRAGILRDALSGMFPGLPQDLPAERFKVWMGHRPSTPDGLPVIGTSAASEDVILAFGHGHVGLVSSARTGRIVAQIASGLTPEIPMAPFSPDRF